MNLALDTNRYSDLHRGDPDVATVLEKAEQIFLPFAALAELHVEFAGGRRGQENERVLQQFLSRPGVSVLYADLGTYDLTLKFITSFAVKERLFRLMTCGLRRYACSTTLRCTREMPTFVICRSCA